ncbi:ABC transporter permease [Methylobacterium sp. JK268]
MSTLALRTRRRPGADDLTLWLGAAITLLLVGTALLSLAWTPEDPARMRILQKLKPPLVSGLLGTDPLGRDVASMLMRGAFNSLAIAFAAVGIGAILGTAIGVAGAARRDLVDAVLMRVCDALFALPPILSAILLGALLGPGAGTAILAIGLFMVPVFARVTRGAAMQVWVREYIAAGRMAGKGPVRLTLEHVLPNIAGAIIVQVTIQLAMAILTEAGLSFLGLGPVPPNPTWGRMLADSQTYLVQAPHLALAPGLAIAASVLGLNLLGDGLAARLDPRRRQAS